jgi:hypothetical protein
MQNLEEKYKIVINKGVQDKRDALEANNFYCLTKNKSDTNRCLCEDFLSKDEELICPCGVYRKIIRTEEELLAYRVPFRYTTD